MITDLSNNKAHTDYASTITRLNVPSYHISKCDDQVHMHKDTTTSGDDRTKATDNTTTGTTGHQGTV
jgi:hypothetical protein